MMMIRQLVQGKLVKSEEEKMGSKIYLEMYLFPQKYICQTQHKKIV